MINADAIRNKNPLDGRVFYASENLDMGDQSRRGVDFVVSASNHGNRSTSTLMEVKNPVKFLPTTSAY